MTAPTRTSAYPKTVDELMPDAVALARRLGETPTRNRLMTELRIGAPKASTLLDRLVDVGTDEASASGSDDPDKPMAARLHLVPAAPGGVHLNTLTPDSQNILVTVDADPAVGVGLHHLTSTPDGSITTSRPLHVWPVYLLALPAFVAVWSGWVGLGELTGFGIVHPLPGIWDSLSLNTAITLPIGVETYAAFSLRGWLVGPARVRRFAKWSAIGSLVLGAGGQVAYHLMSAAGVSHAPWPITTAVACLPVIVLGMGAALAHLLHVGKQS